MICVLLLPPAAGAGVGAAGTYREHAALSCYCIIGVLHCAFTLFVSSFHQQRQLELVLLPSGLIMSMVLRQVVVFGVHSVFTRSGASSSNPMSVQFAGSSQLMYWTNSVCAAILLAVAG
jgi:hypothetical protein